jgi:hypothetical protein
MSGHTPGPWFLGRALRRGQECIIGDGDSVVCFMPDRTIGCTFVRDDALLIAAAPRLLEALWSIVADYEFCKAHPSFGDRGEFYAETALLAIDAATGDNT